MRFVLQRLGRDLETKAVVHYCIQRRIPYRVGHGDPARVKLEEEEVPVGIVEWFQKVSGLGTEPPDYYPDFLASLLGRDVWPEERWDAGLSEKNLKLI